jgi:predicted ATPase
MRSPLVGREEELGILQGAIERLASGVGGIVTLVGGPGIGKSRLVTEARRGVPAKVRWVEGRCLSQDETTAYSLWISMLYALLGVTPRTRPEVIGRALHNQVQGIEVQRRAAVSAYIGRLIGASLDVRSQEILAETDPETLKTATFYALEQLISSVAHHQPLVVVCEDLHWGDPTSLQLLERLLALTERLPLLLLSVLRPRRDHGCWQIREIALRAYPHRLADLQLAPLSPVETDELVQNLLLSLPSPDGRQAVVGLGESLKAQILHRGEGVPFYVEEIIRSLIQTGAIACEAMTCRWQPSHDGDEIRIPDTLYGVLHTRIDQLPLAVRHVLQLAAVVGRIFSYRLLAEVADRDGLDERLLTLQREQLIRERARVPEREYIFEHQLTLEAAYEGLTFRTRRVLHRRVAEALEILHPETIAGRLGLLAHHWERSGEMGRAVTYLKRAGDQAAAQYAATEAAAYYSRALDLIPGRDRVTRYELLMARVDAYRRYGPAVVRARTELGTLMQLADGLADPRKQSDVLLLKAEQAFAASDLETGIATAERAIELAQRAGDVRLEALARYRLGRALSFRADQDPEAANRHIEQALVLARGKGLQDVEARILRRFGVILMLEGEYSRAERVVGRALRLWRGLGNRIEEGRAINALSLVLMGRSAYVEARRLAQQGLELCLETGNHYDEAWALWTLARIVMRQGEYSAARAHAERALQIFRKTGTSYGELWALVVLARLYCYLGDLRTAATYVAETDGLAPVGDQVAGAWVPAVAAFIRHLRGDDRGARDLAHRALDLTPKGSHRRHYLPVLGLALLGLRRPVEAIDALQTALDHWRELNLPQYAAEPVAALAKVAQQQGDLERAQSYVEQTLVLLDNPDALSEAWDPLGVYLTCVQVLRAKGDPRAEPVLARGYRELQARAAKIAEDDLRQSYLEGVPANREIVAQYSVRTHG